MTFEIFRDGKLCKITFFVVKPNQNKVVGTNVGEKFTYQQYIFKAIQNMMFAKLYVPLYTSRFCCTKKLSRILNHKMLL